MTHLVFGHLDFVTLTSLRRVNSPTTAIVDSLPQLQDMAKYAPKVLRGLGATGVLSHFSANKVHFALKTDRCAICSNEFGPFIFLLSCQRCCRNCSKHATELSFLEASQVMADLSIGCEELTNNLPVLHTLKGVYPRSSISPIDFNSERQSLVLSSAASDLASCQGLHLSPPPSHEIREVSLMAFPSLVSADDDTEHGIYCRGCEREAFDHHSIGPHLVPYGVDQDRNRAYSKEEFPEHVDSCDKIEKLRADVKVRSRKWPGRYRGGDGWGRPLYDEV